MPGERTVEVDPEPGRVEVEVEVRLGDSVVEVEVVRAVVVVVELTAGTTDTGNGHLGRPATVRTTRYRLPRPMNATSMSAVDQRTGNRRWIGRRSAAHREVRMCTEPETGSLTAPRPFPR